MISPLSLAATKAAYTQCDQWVDELRAYLDENFEYMKAYLDEHLPKAVFWKSQGTYVGWVDARAYQSSEDEDLSKYIAMRAPVMLEGGRNFVGATDGFLRVNISCPRSLLVKGLAAMCETLNAK